jgi:flagellar hook-associated protein 1 FlgK
MSNLLTMLLNSASTLDTYGRVLDTAQNNVANASTAGYAKQSMDLYALPFDPNSGSTGGVRAGELVSSRNEYAEQSVRAQTSSLGQQQQMVSSLTSVQSVFDISGNQGIPKALNDLFQSFSAWATSPNSQATSQTVIQRATEVAQSFAQAANALGSQAHDTEQQIRQNVDQVNQLVGQLQGYNKLAMAGNRGDAGLDAQVHATLENLSGLVDFTAANQADGTVTVMLNGNQLLLAADKQYQISFALTQSDTPPPTYPNSPATAHIKSSDGNDITSKTTGGQLGALLNVRNTVLSSYIGDAYQPGDLNTMARQFADRVNQVLSSGTTSDGQAGVALFTYDSTNDTAVASSLTVDSNVTPAQLVAADPGPPAVSNGIPLALSQLTTPLQDADKIDGLSYTEFYGGLASRVGGQLKNSTNSQEVQQSLLAQAKNLRQQVSGVSLDEEAAILIEFQRAYQANSKFMTVLDQLTQTTIDLIH